MTTATTFWSPKELCVNNPSYRVLLRWLSQSEKLSVREDKSGRVTVAGLSSPQFSTMEEFDALVK